MDCQWCGSDSFVTRIPLEPPVVSGSMTEGKVMRTGVSAYACAVCKQRMTDNPPVEGKAPQPGEAEQTTVFDFLD